MGLAWLLLFIEYDPQSWPWLAPFCVAFSGAAEMMRWTFGLTLRIPYQVLIDFNYCSRLVFRDYFTRIVVWAEEVWEVWEVWEEEAWEVHKKAWAGKFPICIVICTAYLTETG
jgi:hypothetical protein